MQMELQGRSFVHEKLMHKNYCVFINTIILGSSEYTECNIIVNTLNVIL